MSTMADELFSIIGGPDEFGFYTAHTQYHKYLHLKGDRKTPLYTERYDDIEGFHEGFAVVHLEGKGFHIKPDGTPAYEKRYQGVAMRFVNGRADVYCLPDNLVLIKNDDGTITEEAA